MEKARRLLCTVGVTVGCGMSIYPAVSSHLVGRMVSEGQQSWLLFGGLAIVILSSIFLEPRTTQRSK